MGKNLDELKELGLIVDDEIPTEYQIVIELLSKDELAVLKKIKHDFDVAAEVSGAPAGRLPIVI